MSEFADPKPVELHAYEEAVEIPRGRALFLGAIGYVLMTYTLVMIFLALFMAITVSTGDVGQKLKGLFAFGGFTWLFLSVVTLPGSILCMLFGRKRYARIDGNDFEIAVGLRKARYPVEEIEWHVASWATDDWGTYEFARSLIVVRHGEQMCCVGFDPESFDRWIASLDSVGAEHRPRVTVAEAIPLYPLYGALGAALGALLGGLAALCGLGPGGPPLFALGFANGVMLVPWKAFGHLKFETSPRRRLGCALGFAVLGGIGLMHEGLVIALLGAVANAGVGAALHRYIEPG